MSERWGLTEEQYAQLEEEVVGLLARLLRADTSNPPGDVTPAVSVLEEYFAGNGIALTVAGEAPELPNCVARLEGSGAAPRCSSSGTRTSCRPTRRSGRSRPSRGS